MFAIPRMTLIAILIVAFLCGTTQSTVVDAEQLVRLAMVAERRHPPTTGETVGARPWLSMDAVHAFRAAHAGTIEDRVIARPREGLLVLSMALPSMTVPSLTAPGSELRGVELTMDAETHEVVHEALVFSDVGRVEIERLLHAVPAFVRSRRPPAETTRLPGVDALDRAELRARLVLMQAGVDMKSEIRVSRTPAAVRIESASVPAAQQSRILARLTAIDHVQVDFRSRGAMPEAGEVPPVLPVPTRFGLRHWLDRNFKDASTRGGFFPRLLRSLTIVHQRVRLLAELARLYPDPRIRLSASARPMLQQLVDQHYRHLRTELNDSRVWVAPLSGAVHVVSDTSDTPADLIARAPQALARADAFEQRLYVMLRQNDLSAVDQQQINAGFVDLWRAIYGPLPTRSRAS